MDKATLEKTLDKKLDPLSLKIDELTTSVEETMNTVKFISTQYDDILKKLQSFDEENKRITLENETLRKELRDAKGELHYVKESHNNLEQYSRRDCLEVRGVPVKEGENTNEVIIKVASKVGVKINNEDISTSHRLPSRQKTKPDHPSIIVKFVRRDVRDKLYTARKCLREITTSDLGYRLKNRIYINESLTQENKKLFSKCLQLRHDLNYKFIWTNSGRILMRESEDSPVIRISTEKDFTKFAQRYSSFR